MSRGVRVQYGFTLIELMIVVVILGIITTVAVQYFSGSNQQSQQARIVAQLNSLNDALNRYYQGTYSYSGAAGSPDPTTFAAATSPITTIWGTTDKSPYYNVTLFIPSAQTYYLVASPLSTGMMKGTGQYSINQSGQRCHFTVDSTDPSTAGCPASF